MPPSLVSRRPAESATAAFSLAVVVCYFAGIRDPEFVLALSVVLGGIPSAVTWLVERRRAMSG